MIRNQSHRGFTLVEMIMVIVITGIIGGMVAVFLRAPVQQYMDVSRRADMTDIADTALRRVSRDLRLALPNSVRVTGACNGVGTCFIEFLPTTGGGRYRASVGAGPTAGCGSVANDVLNFAALDTCFEVLGTMPPGITAGDSVVIYNMTSDPADTNPNAYAGGNRSTVVTPTAATITINAIQFPFESPGNRFHVITRPVTYACDVAAGTLTRYWGYAIQGSQANVDTVGKLITLVSPATATKGSALLANNVRDCRFNYDPLVVATQRAGLVTMRLAISRDNETVTLYSATHVSNQP